MQSYFYNAKTRGFEISCDDAAITVSTNVFFLIKDEKANGSFILCASEENTGGGIRATAIAANLLEQIEFHFSAKCC